MRCIFSWISGCVLAIVNRRSDGAPLAELWRVFPPQPSELALPAARRRGFVLSIAKDQRGLFSRCRLVL